MRGKTSAAGALERLERRPRDVQLKELLEEVDELAPLLTEDEAARVDELLSAEREGWQRELSRVLRPARERQRGSMVAMARGRVRSVLARLRPKAPRIERDGDGWLAQSGALELRFTFDPSPGPPPEEAAAEPPAVSVAAPPEPVERPSKPERAEASRQEPAKPTPRARRRPVRRTRKWWDRRAGSSIWGSDF